MAASASAAPGFAAQLQTALTPDERRAWSRLRLRDHLTSLWSPLTVFGLAFAVYLVIVELQTCAYPALQPLLKLFGLLMLAVFLGLLLARLAVRGFAEGIKLRQQAHEQLGEAARLLDQHRAGAKPGVYEETQRRAAALIRRAVAPGSASSLEPELERFSTYVDEQLGHHRRGSGFEAGVGFVKALAVALLIRAVVLEPFKIPSASMVPTLEIGDQIFVNKFIYGVRIPFLNKVPFVIVRPPARGDVIVFNNPVEPDKDFIKRVVGIPGDRVEILDKVVHINGVAQPVQVEAERYDSMEQDSLTTQWSVRESTLVRERLDGQVHLSMRNPGDPRDGEGNRRGDRRGPYLVPPRSVFVMGDSRDNSMDSRYGLGRDELGVQYVPYDSIKGKAMVIWLSLSFQGLGAKLFGGTGLRTDRLFLPVRMCGDEPVRQRSLTP